MEARRSNSSGKDREELFERERKAELDVSLWSGCAQACEAL